MYRYTPCDSMRGQCIVMYRWRYISVLMYRYKRCIACRVTSSQVAGGPWQPTSARMPTPSVAFSPRLASRSTPTSSSTRASTRCRRSSQSTRLGGLQDLKAAAGMKPGHLAALRAKIGQEAPLGAPLRAAAAPLPITPTAAAAPACTSQPARVREANMYVPAAGDDIAAMARRFETK